MTPPHKSRFGGPSTCD